MQWSGPKFGQRQMQTGIEKPDVYLALYYLMGPSEEQCFFFFSFTVEIIITSFFLSLRALPYTSPSSLSNSWLFSSLLLLHAYMHVYVHILLTITRSVCVLLPGCVFSGLTTRYWTTSSCVLPGVGGGGAARPTLGIP